MSIKELKPYLLLITYAGIVFLVVTNLGGILGQISWITSVVSPLHLRPGDRLCAQPPFPDDSQPPLYPAAEKDRPF